MAQALCVRSATNGGISVAPACVAAICEGSPLPVNILWSKPCGDRAALASLGVARISHGHQPWAAAMAWLGVEAATVLGGGVPGYGP